MNAKNYIKVTKAGKSYVLLVGNEAYYRSQGYTIETPTEKEILAAFPELAAEKTAADNARKAATEKAKNEQVIARLKKSNESLKAAIEEKDKAIEELKAAAENPANSEETAAELTEARKTADALQAEVDKLTAENGELKAEVDKLTKKVEDLEKAAAKKSNAKTTK